MNNRRTKSCCTFRLLCGKEKIGMLLREILPCQPQSNKIQPCIKVRGIGSLMKKLRQISVQPVVREHGRHLPLFLGEFLQEPLPFRLRPAGTQGGKFLTKMRNHPKRIPHMMNTKERMGKTLPTLYEMSAVASLLQCRQQRPCTVYSHLHRNLRRQYAQGDIHPQHRVVRRIFSTAPQCQATLTVCDTGILGQLRRITEKSAQQQ